MQEATFWIFKTGFLTVVGKGDRTTEGFVQTLEQGRMWCWLGQVTGESGAQKAQLAEPSATCKYFLQKQSLASVQRHSSVCIDQGFWRGVGRGKGDLTGHF